MRNVLEQLFDDSDVVTMCDRYTVTTIIHKGQNSIVLGAMDRDGSSKCIKIVRMKEKVGDIPLDVHVNQQLYKRCPKYVLPIDYWTCSNQVVFIASPMWGFPYMEPSERSRTDVDVDTDRDDTRHLSTLFGQLMDKYPVGATRDLFAYLKYQGGNVKESVAFHIGQQIAHVLHELHKLGYDYNDLKDENILIDKDLNIKLIDFDHVSARVEPMTNVFRGTLLNAPPETFISGSSRKWGAQDVWGYGLLIFLMLTGRHYTDYESLSNGDMLQRRHDAVMTYGNLQKWTEWTMKVLDRCLDPNPKTRCRIEDMIE